MSDVIRLIAGGLLALICCYIGILIKRRYAEREKFFKDASEFTAFLSSELSFKKTPFPKVVEIFSSGRKGVFIDAVNGYLKRLKGNESIETMLKNAEVPRLKPDEKKNLFLFFDSLGKTSLNDQLGIVTRAGTDFQAKQKKCAEETKRLGGMYFKLLVLLGIVIIVILA